MKKIYIFLFVLFALDLNATIYDFIKTKSDILLPFFNKEINKMNVRINGYKMDISLLEADKSSEEILIGLYNEAEKNNSIFYSNEYVLFIANLLYEIAGKRKYNDEFGYILYKDKNSRMNFFITAGNGIKSEIIKISTTIKNNSRKSGFNDGIIHFYANEKVFSIEILSDSNKTIHFFNFYMAVLGDRCEIRNYYYNSLQKQKFEIVNKYFDEKIDFFILEKKNRNYLFAISEEQSANWIMIMG